MLCGRYRRKNVGFVNSPPVSIVTRFAHAHYFGYASLQRSAQAAGRFMVIFKGGTLGAHFEATVTVLYVRWYVAYPLSYR